MEIAEHRPASTQPVATAKARPPADQPLDVINVPGALLRVDTLSKISGLSEPTLYRAAKRGELVLTKLGARCTRVTSENARAYLQRLAGGAA